MVKFSADGAGGRKLLGFIITDENVARLKKGEPIHVNVDEMGVPNVDFVIHYEPSDKMAVDAVRQFMTKDTVVNEMKEPH